MPAAINLRKVTVSGWKAIDSNPVEIPFDGDSWLIYGGNETGKSSTFSAIRTALFENPGSTGAFADDWVNNQTPNGAKIELELLIDGQEYTIVKTRSTSKSGSTTLYEGCGSRRTQHSTGQDAVGNVLELIGARARGGSGGRNPEQPQNWGVLAWLLAPQGMDSVTPARESGTQTIGLESAVSDQMVEVEGKLKARLGNQLTPTGKPVSSGTYKASIDSEERAIRNLEDIELKRGQYTQFLQRITRVEEEIEVEEAKLAEADQAINDLVGTEVDLSGMVADIATIQGQIDTKEQEIATVTGNITALKGIEEEITQLQSDLDDLRNEIKDVHSNKKELDGVLKSNSVQIEALDGQLKTNSKENLAKQEQWRAAVAEARRAELIEQLEKRDILEGELKELLAKGPILDDDAIGKMNALVDRYERADAMLKYAISEGMGVSVGIEGALDANWSIDGLETEVDSDTTFAQEMTIQSDDFTLNLKKESTEDKNWVEERNKCSSEFKTFSVSGPGELREKIESERLRSSSAETLEGKIGDLQTRKEIEDRLGELPDQSEEEGDKDVNSLSTEIEALVEEKEDLEKLLDDLRETTEPLEKESISLEESRSKLGTEITATEALMKSANERKEAELEANGRMATREKRLKELQGEQEGMKTTRQQLIVRKETEEGAAKDEITQTRKIKSIIERELIGKRADLKSLNSDAEELGGENLQQAIVDAETAVKATKANKDGIERVVKAEERLLARFVATLNEATELEIGPIKDQVQTWMAAVTEGRWTRVEMDSKLNVTRISGPSSPPISGEKVGSGGLKQVIHALIRLAVACKIHDDKSAENPEFPPVALVMDESQGHVDDGRVLRLVGRFNTEIEKGRVQVIALSHRRNEFQALNAMNYNVVRREASDDRGA